MNIVRIALIAALAFVPAAFSAETPSAMLEKGIFQEETAGNLDAAVKVYKQIVDEANAARHAVAEAQYRLGVCYQKLGKNAESQAAFRNLVARYADEKELVAKARKELGEAAPEPMVKYGPPEMNPAPWPDDELMVLSVETKTGMNLGQIFYTAKRVGPGGEPVKPALPLTALSGAGLKGGAWRIESYQVIPMNDWRQYTRVDADALTFAPITGRTKNSMGDFRAAYQPGKVALEVTHDGKPTTRDIPVEGFMYDNEQVIYLLRRLPLREGYNGQFPIFPVMGGAVVECRIRVDGRENVELQSAGRIPCWKIVLSLFNQGVSALQHTLWIEAEGAHRLIQYDSGAAVLKLTFSYPRPGQRLDVGNPEDRQSIMPPPGWFGCFDHLMPQHKFSVQLLPPELKAWAVLTGAVRPPDATARQIAEKDAGILKGFFQNYVVRPDSWSDVTVSGLKAVGYVADFTDKGQAMVEYRTYLLTPSLVVWFVFRVEKDHFEASRPEFDKIVQSLNASGK